VSRAQARDAVYDPKLAAGTIDLDLSEPVGPCGTSSPADSSIGSMNPGIA